MVFNLTTNVKEMESFTCMLFGLDAHIHARPSVKSGFGVGRIKFNGKNVGMKYRASGACKDKNMRVPKPKDVLK